MRLVRIVLTASVKQLGQRLMARDFNHQVAEFQVRVAVQNGYIALGIKQLYCNAVGRGRSRHPRS